MLYVDIIYWKGMKQYVFYVMDWMKKGMDFTLPFLFQKKKKRRKKKFRRYRTEDVTQWIVCHAKPSNQVRTSPYVSLAKVTS